MNKKTTIAIVIGIIIIICVVLLFRNNSSENIEGIESGANVAPVQAPINPSPVAVSSVTAPLIESTGELFSQYKYYSKAHEIFPTLATDTKKALGAFSYTKKDLGNNVYQFTLTNNAEGYKGQSVTVSSGQSVYFIEPFTGDDSATEDSGTTDDILMAVNAQGYILK